MKKHIWLTAVLSLLVATILGCGGGGSSAATATVSGVAAKGLISGGTVKVFAVTGGAKGVQLGTTGTTGTNGAYSINIGSYTGPVLIEVSGTYIDEVSGNTLTITPTAPLRAALANVTANVSAAVTPFTELAVQKAGATLTTATIDAANNLVSNLFQVDIINTMPVDATIAPPSGATAAQINYGLALAAVSQYMNQNLQTFLTDFAISGTSLPVGKDAAFQAAMSTFIADAAKNKTSVTNINQTPFINVGTAVTTTLTSSKSTALANGADTVTFTASFLPSLPDGTGITFAVTSGTATFDNSSTTKTVTTLNNAASATLKSSTIGNVTVTATYLPGSSSSATVNFPQPASAEVQIALNNAVSNLTRITFKVVSNPVATLSSPNEAIGAAQGGILYPPGTEVGDPSTMIKVIYTTGTSINVTANSPIFRLTYTVTAGTIPGFTISPTGISAGVTSNPADPRAEIIPLTLTPSDFVLTVIYKDAANIPI